MDQEANSLLHATSPTPFPSPPLTPEVPVQGGDRVVKCLCGCTDDRAPSALRGSVLRLAKLTFCAVRQCPTCQTVSSKGIFRYFANLSIYSSSMGTAKLSTLRWSRATTIAMVAVPISISHCAYQSNRGTKNSRGLTQRFTQTSAERQQSCLQDATIFPIHPPDCQGTSKAAAVLPFQSLHTH